MPNLFENIVNNNWDAIVFANLQGVVEYANPKAYQLYGYTEGELIGKNVDVFNSHKSHNTDDIVNAIIEKGIWSGELIQRKKGDIHFEALLTVQLINNSRGDPCGYASNSKDISQEKESAKKLKKIIKEKEILLREVHHRVKNNLSVIISMLRLQNEKFKDTYHSKLMDECEDRIHAIATVHNVLYNSESFNEICSDKFLNELGSNIAKTFSHTNSNIKLNIDSAKIPLHIADAIPFGLIVNELITNSYKHGFNNQKEGIISIVFKNKKNPILKISDNGQGFHYSIAQEDTERGLGLSLIKGLVEQINGNLSYENNKGSKFTITFSKN